MLKSWFVSQSVSKSGLPCLCSFALNECCYLLLMLNACFNLKCMDWADVWSKFRYYAPLLSTLFLFVFGWKRENWMSFYSETEADPSSLSLSALLYIWTFVLQSVHTRLVLKNMNFFFLSPSKFCTLTCYWKVSVCWDVPTSVPHEALYECKLLFITFVLFKLISLH